MEITTEFIDNVVVITLEFKTLDAFNIKEFKQKMNPYIQSQTKLIFNLEKLEFIDSSGLGALLSFVRKLIEKNGDLKLYAMSPPIKSLFDLVRFNRIFHVYNTKEEAVESFSTNSK